MRGFLVGLHGDHCSGAVVDCDEKLRSQVGGKLEIKRIVSRQ